MYPGCQGYLEYLIEGIYSFEGIFGVNGIEYITGIAGGYYEVYRDCNSVKGMVRMHNFMKEQPLENLTLFMIYLIPICNCISSVLQRLA